MKVWIRKGVALLLSTAMVFTTLGQSLNVKAGSKPEPYSEHWYDDVDLSKYDFRNDYDLITTYTYGENTKWPAKDKLPSNFNPKTFLEWGKYPGMGMKKLHQMGYTGKGVNVAYIDQNLGKTLHEDLKSIDLHRNTSVMKKWKQNTEKSSMHGPAVLSLLAGKSTGIAPDATVYYVENPSWLADQRSHADCIREIIKENKKLPEEKKIKVIGFSDNIDDREDYPEEMEKATKEANEAGIYVYYCAVVSPCVAEPYSDKDDFTNFHAIDWDGKKVAFENGELYVPSDRTTLVNESTYVKWGLGGLSWTAPQIVGLMAIGLQIDSELTGEEMFQLMKDTAYKPEGIKEGGILNPQAFVQKILENKGENRDYTMFLYNSSCVSNEDLTAMKAYEESMKIYSAVKYLDVKGMKSAEQVYAAMKKIKDSSSEKMKGVQIMGTDDAVPAFDVAFKVQMEKEIDDAGTFKSDYYYGNLDNNPEAITNSSAYSFFQENKKLDVTLDWPVVRLPLNKGEYQAYFAKVDGYNKAVNKMDSLPLTNFSNPIFAQKIHIDDMNEFITKRMDKEFGIIDKKHYSLYGNLDGDYPVQGKVEGNFSTEEMKKVNKKGITDLLINSHGQYDNIDKAIFENGKEKRISTLNNANIGDTLGTNYCNLYTWTCNNAYGLDDENLAHEALAKSKVINVFAATTIISNNGVDNMASLEAMKCNNFYYFYYSFMKNYYGGKNRSMSFMKAKNDYMREIIKHSDKLIPGQSYGFNFNNALAYHQLGLIYLDEPMMNYSNLTSEEGEDTAKEEKKSFTDKSSGQKVTVYLDKDSKGKVKAAKATIIATGTKTSGKTKVIVSNNVITRINKLAGKSNVHTTVTVKSKAGKKAYTVAFDTADVVGKKTLYPFRNMEMYVPVITDIKYTSVSTKKGLTFASKANENYILDTIRTKTIRQGETCYYPFSNLVNVPCFMITYKKNNDVVKIDHEHGDLFGKKVGTCTVSARYYLSREEYYDVKVKIKVVK